MADCSKELLWEVVKKNNCFIRKGLNQTFFSAEPNNLYNKHSYKYCGLTNPKAVGMSADIKSKSPAVKLTRSKKGACNKPAKSTHTITIKQHPRRTLRAVKGCMKGYRPDLTKAALARASALQKQFARAKPQAE